MPNLIKMFFPSAAGFSDAPAKPGGGGIANPDVFGKVLDDARQNAGGVVKVPKPPNGKTGDGGKDASAVDLSDANINPLIPKIIPDPNRTANGPIAQNAPEQLDALNKSGIATDNSPLPMGPSMPDDLARNIAVNLVGQPVETGVIGIAKDSDKNPNEMALDLSGDKGESGNGLKQSGQEDDNSEEADGAQSPIDALTMSIANMVVPPVNPLNLQTHSAAVPGNSEIADERTSTKSIPDPSVETLASYGSNVRPQTANPSTTAALEGMHSDASVFEQTVQKAWQTVSAAGNPTASFHKSTIENPADVTESLEKGSPSFVAAQNPSVPFGLAEENPDDLLKTVGSQKGVKTSNPVLESVNSFDIKKETRTVSQDGMEPGTSGSRNVAATQNPTTGSPTAIQDNMSGRNSVSSGIDLKPVSVGGPNPDSGNPTANQKAAFGGGFTATTNEETQPVQLGSSETLKVKGDSDGTRVNSAQSGIVETATLQIPDQAVLKAQTVSAVRNVGAEGENLSNLRAENAPELSAFNPFELRPAPLVVDEKGNPIPEMIAEIPVIAADEPSLAPKTNSASQLGNGSSTLNPGDVFGVHVGDSANKPGLLDLKSLQSFQVSGQPAASADVMLAQLKPVSLFKNTPAEAKAEGEIRETDGTSTENTDSMVVKTDTPSAKADVGPVTISAASVPANRTQTDSLGAVKDVATDESVPELNVLSTNGMKSADGSKPEKSVESKPVKTAGKTGGTNDFKSSLIAQQPVVSTQTGPEKTAAQNGASSAPNHEDLFGQIMERAKIMIGRGHGEMEINLKPDHLGKLQLRVAIENQVVTAKFAVESQQVKEIIEINLPQLRQQLHDQGIRADALTVSVNLQNNASDWQQPTGQQNRPDFSGVATRGGTETAPDSAEQPVINRPLQSTLVDFIA